MSIGNSIEFTGTPAQEAELKKVIAKYKEQPGGLMPALQEAQGRRFAEWAHIWRASSNVTSREINALTR